MKNVTQILLIEDNEGDIVLTMEAFAQTTWKTKIHVTRDGEQALSYLKRKGMYEDAVIPDLILLDINLPRIDGKEVLKYVKSDPLLRCIPVLMLTTSSSETDIRDAYAEHANCYITKPVDFSRFMQVVESIKEFWLNTVMLPKNMNYAEYR